MIKKNPIESFTEYPLRKAQTMEMLPTLKTMLVRKAGENLAINSSF